MYLGKTLFAQVMDFLPWKSFPIQLAAAVRRILRHAAGYRS